MPIALPNTTTANDYPAPGTGGAQVGIGDVFASGFFVVANASVAAEFYHGAQGQQAASPEVYLAPGTYPLAAGVRDPLGGIRFRSAVAGTPAQVFGAFYYPGEASIQAGGQFTATIAPSGSVINPGTGAMQVIQDQLLLSSALTIDFQNIAQTFAHLLLVASVRTDAAAVSSTLAATLNGDNTAGHYADDEVQANGATVTGALNDPDSAIFLGTCPGATAPAGSFGVCRADILDYTNTAKHKGLLALCGARTVAGSSFPIQWTADMWLSTATVTRLTLFPSGGVNFITGSRATLYGLTSA